MHDACYNKAMRSYGKWSARAAQATAKCRKKHGRVRKGAAGASLKRWGKEKWVDVRTNKPCGHDGPGVEYCRPSKKVSSKTPKTRSELSQRAVRQNVNLKKSGKRAAAQTKKPRSAP